MKRFLFEEEEEEKKKKKKKKKKKEEERTPCSVSLLTKILKNLAAI